MLLDQVDSKFGHVGRSSGAENGLHLVGEERQGTYWKLLKPWKMQKEGQRKEDTM